MPTSGVSQCQCTTHHIQPRSSDTNASKPLGLTVTRAAEALGVNCQTLSDLVNERAGVSADMAVRLSEAFGSTPETWLRLQTAYDLWQVRDLKQRSQ